MQASAGERLPENDYGRLLSGNSSRTSRRSRASSRRWGTRVSGWKA